MRTLLAVNGPLDGKLLTLPDEILWVGDEAWPGIYRRLPYSPRVEVWDYHVPSPTVDRWAPRKRTAHFGVARKPFGR